MCDDPVPVSIFKYTHGHNIKVRAGKLEVRNWKFRFACPN